MKNFGYVNWNKIIILGIVLSIPLILLGVYLWTSYFAARLLVYIVGALVLLALMAKLIQWVSRTAHIQARYLVGVVAVIAACGLTAAYLGPMDCKNQGPTTTTSKNPQPSNPLPVYTLNPYVNGDGTITLSVDGGTVSGSSGAFPKGQVVTLTATPSFGYRFTGWSIGGPNPQTIIMNSNENITALFVAETPGPAITLNGSVGPAPNSLSSQNRVSATKSVQLVQYQWIKGTISGSATNHDTAWIGDPSGKVLSQTAQYMGGNLAFAFMAQTTGTYTFTVSTGEIYDWSYNLTYTIWR